MSMAGVGKPSQGIPLLIPYSLFNDGRMRTALVVWSVILGLTFSPLGTYAVWMFPSQSGFLVSLHMH
jgi:hypothetical protein